MEYNIGDLVKTKKKHPCNNDIWEIIGIGVEYKLKCTKCKRVIILDRENAKRRIVKKVQ